jgi:D-galactarolactone cycloisomerase
MTRRYFFFGLAGAAVAAKAAPRSGARITNIRAVSVQGRFHKFVAMNAYDRAPKGHTYEHALIRIETNQGVEGIGAAGYSNVTRAVLEEMRPLIGADPMEIYRMEGGRIIARSPAFAALLAKHKYLDGPLYDLIGKLSNRPAWQLIGDSVRDRVEVYDGTLYFSDVWFRDRGARAVVEEVEEALRSGYLGVKLKLGRGFKWMPKDEGRKRDIAVVEAVRKAAGPQAKVMADANNGYQGDFDAAWTLLSETRGANFYWMEEIFPESVDGYTKLKAKMTAAGMKTLIADGENLGDPEQFEAYLKPKRLMDVVQMDIRRGGFLASMELARMAEAAGGVSIPHNWASQIGGIMGLHLAKAVKGVPAAEDDRSTCDVLIADGYQFRNGQYTVPNDPGLGIRIDAKVYADKYMAAEIAIGD